MSENELSQVEHEWKNRFDRFTVPEPTREQTLQLIDRIKAVDEAKPLDLRAELEASQAQQTVFQKMASMFLSQWNFHGAASWLLTGAVILIITFTISGNFGDAATGFNAWIKWISLLMIAVIGYAFRAKNEGNRIIETLSYYPLIQQMFTRFLIVITLQLVIALPLSFFVFGEASSVIYIASSFTPLFFFGVIGFVSTIWLGEKLGLLITLSIWFSQLFVKEPVLLQVPSLFMHLMIISCSVLLLTSLLLKKREVQR
ncbi:hypothetical protein [Bacillus sp. FJAT-50079]|uniref:hypothetical protein n=1 Tax=Bacillus sp. FJAT-50079 TaxID=2833577 RepID=UPI001BC98517|nr:hypothetical protein [Bacillus sp. FJAT-50079]MBS4209312.1 hypothetical protein [Bacillus sp. FJAT-50079]